MARPTGSQWDHLQATHYLLLVESRGQVRSNPFS